LQPEAVRHHPLGIRTILAQRHVGAGGAAEHADEDPVVGPVQRKVAEDLVDPGGDRVAAKIEAPFAC
jgi:hypothetical protein